MEKNKKNTIDLNQATDEAIKASVQEIKKIEDQVNGLTDVFQSTVTEAQNLQIDIKSEYDPSQQLAEYLEESCFELNDLFKRQKKVLSNFNIVLFGRTGTGKSSLISAIIEGNGESVSHGESDWTTKVKPSEWHSCQIYDTPGINGWGRTESREDLEEKARKAVEIADFVLVCFDSQSQQADEFKKLANWVQTYQKPIIAILNPRNHLWRQPQRTSYERQRISLSTAVRQHASNIRDELAKIGLPDVPVIALNSKRALFARATLPYKGPDLVSFKKQRETIGCELLEEWSCYPRLEKLLIETISQHAVDFRIGALNDQIRGVFKELFNSLKKINDELEIVINTIESDKIKPLFKLLGYPSKLKSDYRDKFVVKGQDLLSELENLRKGAFQSPLRGDFHQFITQRIETEFGDLRTRSLDAAEECIQSAFDKREAVSAEDMRNISFDDSKIEKTAQKVIDEGIKYLKRKIDIVQRDTVLNLKYHAKGIGVDGNAGNEAKKGAFALNSGGVLAGAIGALGTFAAFNIWNPAGWAAGVAAGIALIGGLCAASFKWLGTKLRRKAEKDRLSARRRALANIRKNIHEVYDGIIFELTEHANKNAVNVSTKVLIPLIKHSITLRTVQNQCISLLPEIKNLTKNLADLSEPQKLMLQVQRSIEQELFPKQSNSSNLYWLGEDWIKDSTGLKKESVVKPNKPTKAYDSSYFDKIFSGIKGVFYQISEQVKSGSGEDWLSNAIKSCEGDQVALNVLSELTLILDEDKPRIHLIGDYNAGKSSFIKRLIIDEGASIPENLKIDAKPTTSTPQEYDWNGVKLIDSPGFQSSEISHTEYAMKTFPDASAIIFLFQPNLILGDDTYLKTVLNGDKESGLVPKKKRTFFIINRSDELGSDPEYAPKSFKTLIDRKKDELSSALKSKGVSVDRNQIFCMASDPYGLVGDRSDVNSSEFDPYRSWDGINYFVESFRDSRRKTLNNGVDRSILEGGIARLRWLEVDQESTLEKLSEKEVALSRLELQVKDIVSDGRRIGAKQETKLNRLISEQAYAFKEDILAEQDQKQIELKAERFEEWWKDEALQVEINQWAKETSQTLNAWLEQSFEAINRRMNSAEFRETYGEYDEKGPGIKKGSEGKNLIKETVDKIGRTLGGATRDAVYQIGKGLGFKFKPWGAVNLAKNLGKAGAVMAVAGVVFDIVDMVLQEKHLKEREKSRKKIAAFLNDSIPKIVDAVAYGEESDPGIIKQLESMNDIFTEINQKVVEKRNEISSLKRKEQKKLSTYNKLKIDAIKKLGNPWEE